ncbi:MAG: hypothetical protein U0640_16085 [Phycisphaerales bacterium]
MSVAQHLSRRENAASNTGIENDVGELAKGSSFESQVCVWVYTKE